MKISFRLEATMEVSKEFLGSAEWALREGLMTEEQLVDVIADEIISNVRLVEE